MIDFKLEFILAKVQCANKLKHNIFISKSMGIMLLDDLFLDDITESFAITLTYPLNCAWSALNVFEHNSYHIKNEGCFTVIL